jgi:hypothetical protein
VISSRVYINFLTGLRSAWNIAILIKDFPERKYDRHIKIILRNS